MYASLEQLALACARGEVTQPVTLDNDDTYLYVPIDDDPGAEWARVFSGGHPRQLLEAALDLLGIPHQEGGL